MTLQQLEYVLAVNSLRHFARAAEQCRVTQPTLSMMIQKLEEELDIRIFDRGVQPVQPTAAGKRVIEKAQEVLYQASLIKDIIREEEQSLKGAFRLAVLPTIAPYLLPRFFPRLMAAYPGLEIQVFEMKTNDSLAALQNGSVDAALLATKIEDKQLRSEILYYEPFYGYVSRNEPAFKKELIRTSDIDGERLWLLDEGHCFRDQLVRFCQLEAVKVHQASYRLGSMETFMRMVESGEGITFIPGLVLEQLSREQQELVRPFAVPRPVRAVELVVRTDFVRYAVLDLLRETIRKAVPQEMLALQPTQKLM